MQVVAVVGHDEPVVVQVVVRGRRVAVPRPTAVVGDLGGPWVDRGVVVVALEARRRAVPVGVGLSDAVAVVIQAVAPLHRARVDGRICRSAVAPRQVVNPSRSSSKPWSTTPSQSWSTPSQISVAPGWAVESRLRQSQATGKPSASRSTESNVVVVRARVGRVGAPVPVGVVGRVHLAVPVQPEPAGGLVRDRQIGVAVAVGVQLGDAGGRPAEHEGGERRPGHGPVLEPDTAAVVVGAHHVGVSVEIEVRDHRGRGPGRAAGQVGPGLPQRGDGFVQRTAPEQVLVAVPVEVGEPHLGEPRGGRVDGNLGPV